MPIKRPLGTQQKLTPVAGSFTVPATTDAATTTLVNNPASTTAAALSASTAGRREFIAIGNSITNMWSSDGGTAFVAKIASRLGGLGGTLLVVPAGVGGDKTSDILGRLPALIAAHHPSVVLVVASVNDRKVSVGLALSQTLENVARMVGIIRLNGAIPVLQLDPPLNPPVATVTDAAFTYSSEYDARTSNAQLRAYALTQGIPIADVPAAFAYNDVSGCPDGIHPNGTTGSGYGGLDVVMVTIADAIGGRALQVYGTPHILPTLHVSDDFTRADSTTTPGGTWTVQTGTWGISSGRLYSVTAGTWDAVTVDTAVTDHVAVATGVGTAGATYTVAAITRHGTGGQHYLALLEVAINRSATVKFYKVAPGPAPTQLGSTFSIPVGCIGDSVVLTLGSVGTKHSIRVDGITVVERTDTTYTAGTRVGTEVVGATPYLDRFAAYKP